MELGARVALGERRFVPLLVMEEAALAPLRDELPEVSWDRLRIVREAPTRDELLASRGELWVLDPTSEDRSDERRVTPGVPTAADARGALRALDAGVALVRSDDAPGDALVTAPLSKAEIAKHLEPGFRGHTDYLARGDGLERYGRDYLMGFLAPDLRVALLSTHVSLRRAIDGVTEDAVLDAVRCLARHGGPGREPGPIAVCGLNPHAGESGLLGREDEEIVRPAIERARAEGIDVRGPESADSVFARARRGEFRWVLALYHDQGLVAVKTAAFGRATNWTLGLSYLRTSVDHGTAYEIAGRGVADGGSLRAVIDQTLRLVAAWSAGRG